MVAAALFLLLAIAGGGTAAFAAAQDATPASLSDHPIVGTWILVADGEPSVTAFTSDGIVIDTEMNGDPGLGSWRASDEDSAEMTMIIQSTYPEFGFSGTVVVRGVADVGSDGDSLSVAYSVTGISHDGTVVFDEAGTGTAYRLKIEAADMGGNAVPGYPAIAGEGTPES